MWWQTVNINHLIMAIRKATDHKTGSDWGNRQESVGGADDMRLSGYTETHVVYPVKTLGVVL